MLRLQRYLLGELLASFVLLALIITGVFVVGVTLQLLQKFPAASVSALLSASPSLVALALPITLPLSFLTACLLGYGRFADDNEFLAFQMGGLSPWHAVAPAVCVAAGLSVGMVELGSEITPTLRAAPKAIARGEIREQVARMRSSPATSVKFDNFEMSWDTREGDAFRDVFLTWTTADDRAHGRVPNRAHAESATVQLTEDSPLLLIVTLHGAAMDQPSGQAQTTIARAEVLPVVVDVDQDLRNDPKSKDAMRSSELYYRIARLEPTLIHGGQLDKDEGARLELSRKYKGEYWRRIAFGISPLVFAVLGVPLGLLVRRGSRAQAFVLALFIALPVYYPLLLWGDNLAAMGKLPAPLALNLANILLSAVGLALLGRLVTR